MAKRLEVIAEDFDERIEKFRSKNWLTVKQIENLMFGYIDYYHDGFGKIERALKKKLKKVL